MDLSLALRIVLSLANLVLAVYFGMKLGIYLIHKRGYIIKKPWREVRDLMKHQGIDPDDFEIFLCSLILSTHAKFAKNSKAEMIEAVNSEIGGLLGAIEEYASENKLTNWHIGLAAFTTLEMQTLQATKEFDDIMKIFKRKGPEGI